MTDVEYILKRDQRLRNVGMLIFVLFALFVLTQEVAHFFHTHEVSIRITQKT